MHHPTVLLGRGCIQAHSSEMLVCKVHRLDTQAVRAQLAQRNQAVEPVFDIALQMMGWHPMGLRRTGKAQGERSLVTVAWNIWRTHVLQVA